MTSNAVQPDVLWNSPASRCVLVDDAYFRGAPDLVVEVLSPSTALRDKQTKFRLYEKYGVREYWIVEPTAQYVEVWALVEAKFVAARRVRRGRDVRLGGLGREGGCGLGDLRRLGSPRNS